MVKINVNELLYDGKFVYDACNEIDSILERFDYSPMTELARHVAKLCNIDTADIYSSRDKSNIAQARWLLWYAYRQATSETYEMITKRVEFNGNDFCSRAVASGIEKMFYLITHEDIWQKRWMVLKKLIGKKTVEKSGQNTLVVNIPPELKDKLNIQIIEK